MIATMEKKSSSASTGSSSGLPADFPWSEVDMGLMMDQLHADSAGMTLEDYRAWKALNESLHEEAERYRRAPPASWPKLEFNWDHREESQRFALDGMRPDTFAEQYPNGFRLGQVSLAAFDQRLRHFNRRSPDELWDVGFEGSLARVIAYLRRGLPITPPLVIVVKDELGLAGGNHRYAAAKASRLETLQIYVEHHVAADVGKRPANPS